MHSVLEAQQTILGDNGIGISRQIHNTAVSRINQVFGCHIAAPVIIHANRIRIHSPQIAIDQHYRTVDLLQQGNQLRSFRHIQQNNSAKAILVCKTDTFYLPFGVRIAERLETEAPLFAKISCQSLEIININLADQIGGNHQNNFGILLILAQLRPFEIIAQLKRGTFDPAACFRSHVSTVG